MKRKGSILFALIFAVFAGFLLAGCSGNEEAAKQESGNKEVKDIKELVHGYSSKEIKAESASISSHELIVTEEDGTKSTYDLPEDEFFLSIAPYVTNTHE